MKKTAIIYDKWLAALGGGELVACVMGKILLGQGYDVTFISGKKVPLEKIQKAFKVNLKKAKFIEIWNDEYKVTEFSKGKDLFINISFIDYTFAKAKKNIYYTHFPTEPYNSIKGFIFTNFLLPLLKIFFNIYEIISDIQSTAIKNSSPAYKLGSKARIAYPFLNKTKEYTIEFSLYLENFYKLLLENIKWDFENAEIIDKIIIVKPHINQLNFKLKIKPSAETVYLNIKSKTFNNHDFEEDALFLLFPKKMIFATTDSIYKKLNEKVNTKLRAGVFINLIARLGSYDTVIVHSLFVKHWVKKYWRRDAVVLYPPVDLLFKKYSAQEMKKKNYICSVGRFFTLGHGKKQEVMVQAFKKLYDSGYKDWQLHLIGGVGQEPTSIEFVNRLVNDAQGYPIYFHFNATRKEVEHIYLQSRIYWHAAGFNINQNKSPIRLEHFGITAVEALSARCIPILYKAGGLKEIINIVGLSEEQNLFFTIDELVKNTILHIDHRIHIDWDNIFKKLDNNFSVEVFRKNFLELIKY